MDAETEGLTPTEDPAIALARSNALAIYCDFDGTYSVQDVGSTLARKHLGPRRIELWSRYESGELDAWEYNIELFAGFRLPESELQAFLATIELDPGARALQSWCSDQGTSFRILSDGFDYNLNWLQQHNSVQFDFTSNHLEYAGAEGDEWRIAPGGRNPACSCGTGTCKRAIIAARRREQPGTFCVHIGNGRVSDLCGAEEADLAFAKETLADALRERKQHYEPFETLHDVVAKLALLVTDAQVLRAG